MCGRYQFTAEQCEEIRQIAEAIQRKYGAGAWTPGEIRPSNHAPVLLDGAGGPVPKLMKWGYQLPGTLVINARAETAAEKPLFRDSVRSRRCLIPSTGFYEWDGQKRKYLFTLPREGALYMAGLYDRRGSEECYCILTTAPNASMRPIHDRMPLILTGEQRQRWLADADAATEILTVAPPELTRASAEAKNKEAADLVRSTASCCDRVAGAEMDGSDQLPHLHQDGGQRRGLLVELLQKFQQAFLGQKPLAIHFEQLVLLAVHRVVGQAEDSLLHKAENAAAEILASIRDAPDQIPAQSLSVRFVEILQSDESGAGLLKDVADPLLLRKFR